ncbi:hypothetical protein A3Q56_03931 [Intoshia linei]|uniref:EF-hand domain-containing protein n=1 Tax=Intoshia linei TaxID=1819745 RepID=A0A177B235_9BILA|nr:hypothetical protein A3Q56_03931 [Intoshia linei]
MINSTSNDSDYDTDLNNEIKPKMELLHLYHKISKHLNARICSKFSKCVDFKGRMELNFSHLGLKENDSKNVSSLDFSNNNLGKGLLYILQLFHYCNITLLNLSRIDMANVNALAYGLKYTKSLRTLDLSDNKFGNSHCFITLTKSLIDTKIENINFSNINLRKDDCVKHLGRYLCLSKYLTDLNVSWNSIRKNNVSFISRGLLKSKTIKHLNISWNGIESGGLIQLCRSIKLSKCLQTINISANRINNKGFFSIIKILNKCQSTKEIYIGNNPICDPVLHMGFTSALKCEKIKINLLNLSNISIQSKSTLNLIKSIHEKFSNFHISYGYSNNYGTCKISNSLVLQALRIMTTYCFKNNIKILDLFSQFDNDGSMSITPIEFRRGISDAKISLSMLQIDAVIKYLDQDGDGEIDFSELVLGTKIIEDEDNSFKSEN